MGYYFEWDPRKASSNLRKHDVPFEEATSVFGDPLAMNMPDPDHSVDENRFILLGLSHKFRLLVVAYAKRGRGTRLISARVATRQERRTYEEGQN